MEYKYKYSIICCARWERRYIGEWLAYYHEIGFDHVYLICNDDDPHDFFEHVEQTPVPKTFYSLKYWPGKGEQHAMYRDALQTARQESEWVGFLDVDEFLDLTVFQNIKTYMAFQVDDVDAVYFNWLNFKTSGFRSRPYGSVLRQYVYRERKLNAHTKYICRSSLLTSENITEAMFPFHHALSSPPWSNAKIVNAIGDNWTQYVDNFPYSAQRHLEAANPSLLCKAPHIKHFHLRSEEDIIIRCLRSTSGSFVSQKNYLKDFLLNDNDFSRVERGEIYDDSLKVFAERQALYFDNSYSSQENKIVLAENKYWKGNIRLNFSDGRAIHLEHKTTGDFSYHDHLLILYWDKYPFEVFLKHGNIFKAITLSEL